LKFIDAPYIFRIFKNRCMKKIYKTNATPLYSYSNQHRLVFGMNKKKRVTARAAKAEKLRYAAVVIHYGEIGVKGKNRGRFVSRLYRNIEASISGEKYESLENSYDRIILHLAEDSDLESIANRLKHVFGIAWFAPALMVKNDRKEIIKTAIQLSKASNLGAVKVVPHRSDKSLGFTSHELVRDFIEAAKRAGVVADKDAPHSILINVSRNGTFINLDKIKGLGGLPVGSSGKAVVLMSGGIDSPVAAYFAMKRGLEPVFLHVHAFSDPNEAIASEKIKGLVSVLAEYAAIPKGGRPRVYYVPGHIFLSYASQERTRYELVLFKKFLYRIAEKIARIEGAGAIVTGDSLGQVASQTLTNLASSSNGIKTLLLRPLIGFDKNEIVEFAKKIGTYELSLMPYRDVCSISSRNPKTSSDPKVIDQIYKRAILKKAESETMRRVAIA